MSSYFTVPLFARAKKNQDALRESNPKEPMLNQEDEKFLEKQISSDEVKERIIFGLEKDNPTERPSSSSSKKQKWDSGMNLPSQEEAEAITHNYHDATRDKSVPNDPSSSSSPSSSSRPWTSYLPTLPSLPTKKPQSPSSPSSPAAPERTWTQAAASLLPSSLLPSRTDSDASPTPILNPDGSVNESATRAQQENEISVLLSQLNASTLNNKVFALSSETQKLYERFARVLRDTINGVPTAYEDMETLMKEAGPTLEAQFKGLPPFVRTLVKGLPAKLMAMGPEILAGTAKGEAGVEVEGKEGKGGEGAKGNGKKKRRRRIPGLKSLISKEGVLASMLRATVEFVRVRFPFLASMTNVVMSLAVFILMFVCWYCHKRGKEVRLAKEADAEKAAKGEGAEDDDEDGDDDESSSEEEENPELEAKIEKEIDEKLHESDNVSKTDESEEPATTK